MNLKVVNKKVFVVSDIHNDADRFKLLLEKIDFAEDDILILAGDIFDRGNQPIELYFEILLNWTLHCPAIWKKSSNMFI